MRLRVRLAKTGRTRAVVDSGGRGGEPTFQRMVNVARYNSFAGTSAPPTARLESQSRLAPAELGRSKAEGLGGKGRRGEGAGAAGALEDEVHEDGDASGDAHGVAVPLVVVAQVGHRRGRRLRHREAWVPLQDGDERVHAARLAHRVAALGAVETHVGQRARRLGAAC